MNREYTSSSSQCNGEMIHILSEKWVEVVLEASPNDELMRLPCLSHALIPTSIVFLYMRICLVSMGLLLWRCLSLRALTARSQINILKEIFRISTQQDFG